MTSISQMCRLESGLTWELATAAAERCTTGSDCSQSGTCGLAGSNEPSSGLISRSCRHFRQSGLAGVADWTESLGRPLLA